jgi:endonuclease/exonuclease/phosphatase family metal-dependent hydrolase
MRVLRAGIALLVLGCASSQPPAEPAPFRVMTFNIRLNLASDGPNAWPLRKEIATSMIRFHRADLFGVQEALPEQLRDFDAMLPPFRRFGVGRNAERSGEHSAIFYRHERFEVLKQDTFWLSETPDVAGVKGWDAAYERIVTWGHLRDRRTGATFFYFNTHFDHVGQQARRESARLLVRKVDEIAGRQAPVIVTGDFNDVAGSEPYRIVIEAGFRDAYSSSRLPHHGPTSTWNAFKAIEPNRRIDFVFVRGGIDVLQHAILSDTFDGRFPSDHLPVVADVAVTSARTSLPAPPPSSARSTP